MKSPIIYVEGPPLQNVPRFHFTVACSKPTGAAAICKNPLHPFYLLCSLEMVTDMAAVRGEDLTPSEGDKVKIHCAPDSGAKTPLVMWFRIVQNRVEFIGSFNSAGADRNVSPSFGTLYSSTQMADGTLTLKAFSAARDGGAYSCASMRSNALQFGKVTRLPGAEKPVKPVTPAPARPTAKAKVSPVACNCPNTKTKQGSIVCQPVILGSLAGGCGLLLLLLIATIIHCNSESKP
ncbi:unnamed protein product [Merluccius merluccius]